MDRINCLGETIGLKKEDVPFAALAEALPNIVLIFADGSIIYANRRCEDLLQYSTSELSSPQFNDVRLFAEDRRPVAAEAIHRCAQTGEATSFESRMLTRTGHFRDVSVDLKKIDCAGKAAVLAVVTDMTDTKRAEAALRFLNRELTESNHKLKQMVFTDSHTGLYNHHYLEEILAAEFARAKREHSALSVIMLDIDYFKSINDLYGHKFGDQVIKQFADRLRRIVRKYNSVVRYGGEEFVVISPETGHAPALHMAQRLLDAVNLDTFGTKRDSVKLKLSIAVVTYPDDGTPKALDMIAFAERILNKAKEMGGNRVFSSADLKKNIRQNAARKNAQDPDVQYLQHKIDRLNKRANENLIEAIFAFARTIECKDHYTGEHVEKTVRYATKLAEKLGLNTDDVLLIKQAAMLHDLGKIGVSERILLKPAKLSAKEFEAIKEHPQIGADIIRPIHMLHDIVPLIMYHHERWDGKGYPLGLKGEEIPVGARVIALADTYQALTSNRPYRKAFNKGRALEIIEEASGTQFDPHIASTFLRIM